MLLTGAMTIIVPGSSAQLVIALLIVLINTSLVLKLAPFVDEADDWLAFLTNIQMVITIQLHPRTIRILWALRWLLLIPLVS